MEGCLCPKAHFAQIKCPTIDSHVIQKCLKVQYVRIAQYFKQVGGNISLQ